MALAGYRVGLVSGGGWAFRIAVHTVFTSGCLSSTHVLEGPEPSAPLSLP